MGARGNRDLILSSYLEKGFLEIVPQLFHPLFSWPSKKIYWQHLWRKWGNCLTKSCSAEAFPAPFMSLPLFCGSGTHFRTCVIFHQRLGFTNNPSLLESGWEACHSYRWSSTTYVQFIFTGWRNVHWYFSCYIEGTKVLTFNDYVHSFSLSVKWLHFCKLQFLFLVLVFLFLEDLIC